jgi:transcriptional regulator with XRE-family HTH domain
MENNTFGTRLRAARKSANMTQKELASAIGAKHNSVSNWENDQNMPDPDTIVRICEVLNVGADYMLPSKQGTIVEKLTVSKPRENMEAHEVRNFLHDLIDQLGDEDLYFMKEFSLRIARK